MSGGHFEYENNRMYEWSDETDHKELKKLLVEVAELLHSYDWAVSGDTNMNDFEEHFEKWKKESGYRGLVKLPIQ